MQELLTSIAALIMAVSALLGNPSIPDDIKADIGSKATILATQALAASQATSRVDTTSSPVQSSIPSQPVPAGGTIGFMDTTPFVSWGISMNQGVDTDNSGKVTTVPTHFRLLTTKKIDITKATLSWVKSDSSTEDAKAQIAQDLDRGASVANKQVDAKQASASLWRKYQNDGTPIDVVYVNDFSIVSPTMIAPDGFVKAIAQLRVSDENGNELTVSMGSQEGVQ